MVIGYNPDLLNYGSTNPYNMGYGMGYGMGYPMYGMGYGMGYPYGMGVRDVATNKTPRDIFNSYATKDKENAKGAIIGSTIAVVALALLLRRSPKSAEDLVKSARKFKWPKFFGKKTAKAVEEVGEKITKEVAEDAAEITNKTKIKKGGFWSRIKKSGKAKEISETIKKGADTTTETVEKASKAVKSDVKATSYATTPPMAHTQSFKVVEEATPKAKKGGIFKGFKNRIKTRKAKKAVLKELDNDLKLIEKNNKEIADQIKQIEKISGGKTSETVEKAVDITTKTTEKTKGYGKYENFSKKEVKARAKSILAARKNGVAAEKAASEVKAVSHTTTPPMAHTQNYKVVEEVTPKSGKVVLKTTEDVAKTEFEKFAQANGVKIEPVKLRQAENKFPGIKDDYMRIMSPIEHTQSKAPKVSKIADDIADDLAEYQDKGTKFVQKSPSRATRIEANATHQHAYAPKTETHTYDRVDLNAKGGRQHTQEKVQYKRYNSSKYKQAKMNQNAYKVDGSYESVVPKVSNEGKGTIVASSGSPQAAGLASHISDGQMDKLMTLKNKFAQQTKSIKQVETNLKEATPVVKNTQKVQAKAPAQVERPKVVAEVKITPKTAQVTPKQQVLPTTQTGKTKKNILTSISERVKKNFRDKKLAKDERRRKRMQADWDNYINPNKFQRKPETDKKFYEAVGRKN